MTTQQIELIRQSWALVQPMSKQAGRLFYDKLFTMAPGLRHLFKDDISEQAEKLMVILGYVVSKLNKMDELVGDVRTLGAQHNAYGAQPAHYEAVGQCLIATLRDGLGPAWNAETENAWTV